MPADGGRVVSDPKDRSAQVEVLKLVKILFVRCRDGREQACLTAPFPQGWRLVATDAITVLLDSQGAPFSAWHEIVLYCPPCGDEIRAKRRDNRTEER